MQSKQIRIRLDTDETGELREMAENMGLEATTLALIFVRAGMDAARSHGNRVELPLRFEIVKGESTQPFRLNEPVKPLRIKSGKK